jgi:hypothetical protein
MDSLLKEPNEVRVRTSSEYRFTAVKFAKSSATHTKIQVGPLMTVTAKMRRHAAIG